MCIYIYTYMYNILTFFRAYTLTFYLTYFLTLYPAVFLALYLTSILTFFLAYILTFFLELYLTYVLTFYLAVFLASILTFYVPVQAWPHPELETLTWVGKNIFESVKSRVPGYIHVHPCTSMYIHVHPFLPKSPVSSILQPATCEHTVRKPNKGPDVSSNKRPTSRQPACHVASNDLSRPSPNQWGWIKW